MPKYDFWPFSFDGRLSFLVSFAEPLHKFYYMLLQSLLKSTLMSAI